MYNRPAALVAFSDDKTGKGSARSYADVDIYTILKRCFLWLKTLGGHKNAAGFTIEEEKFNAFKESLWRETLRLIPYPLSPKPLEIEGEIYIEELNTALLKGLRELSPFGEGHPEPIFMIKRVIPKFIRVVGNNHLRFLAIKEKIGVEAVAFKMGENEKIREGEPIDIAFSPELNEWQGKKELQLNVKDFRESI